MRVRAVSIAGLAALALAAPAQADTWTVTDGSSDATTPACNATTHACVSLRAAIAASEISRPDDIINVPPGTINVTDDLVVASTITIVGTSARTNIIDGGAKSRGLRVTSAGTAVLSHFTIRNGAAGRGGSNDGGGILNLGGSLGLDSVRVTGSHAARGGGIANLQGVVAIQHGLVDGNVATGDGGGIANIGGPETTPITWLDVADSTISGNTGGDGNAGGIASRNTGSIVTLNRATIADNVVVKGGVGGLAVGVAGRVSVTGSIIARNRSDGATLNCGPIKPVDGGANVEDEKQCAFDFGSADPRLDTKLSNQGGELDVLAIDASSPAVDRLASGDACKPPLFDQRGLYRPQGAACDAGAYELDQPATMTITSGPSGTVTSGDVEFTFSASEPGVNPVCQLTGPGQTGGFIACYKINAQPYSGLGNGTYTFSVRDGAFPTGPAASRTFTVAGLDTTITGGPSGLTNDATPTFTFTGTSAFGFECRVDTASFAPCISPFTTATLADGQHTFEARALGATGAPDPTPASRTFTVDTVAPNTSIATGPSGSVNSTSATFTFTATETPATFQCSLDGAAFGPCPVSYTGLAQGSHTFQVRATDAAGNTDQTPASRTWIVDTIAPDTTITAGPNGAVASTSATFTFTATETPATFQCSLDGAAFGTCPTSYTGLAQGAHTFQVRATDAAGNTDPTPAARTWTVDTVAPDTTITGGPNGATNATSATFTYISTESGSTFQCSLDGAAFSTCPTSYTGLAQGAHTFQVRATDAAGNADQSPASRTWTVDTVAPNTTLVPIASPTNDATPSFTFSSEAGAAFECRVDGAAYAACTSPHTTATLSDGTHTFDVRARDAAGNVDASPGTQTFVVDTTAPNTTLTPTQTPTNDTTPTWTFGSEAGATFECRVDGAAYAACTSPFTSTALTAGSHTFDVRARDAAGNVDPTPATQTFTIDLTPPDTTISAPAPSPSNDTTPTFAFTSEAGATFQCRVDGGTFAACTSPFTSAVLGAGTHTFEVRALDAAGNPDPTPAAQTFVIDLTAPDTTLTPIPTPGNDSTPTFTFSSSEPGSTFECRVDAAAFAPCTSPHTTAALGDGSHTFAVRATDPSGNTDASPAAQTFVIDTTTPDTTIVDGPGAATNDTTPTFTFTGANGATQFQCNVDGVGFSACSSPFTTAALAPGSHTVSIRALNGAGTPDPSPATRTFVVDLTPPDTTITAGPPSPSNDTTPTFSFGSTETGSTFECRVDGAAFSSCTSPHTTAALAAGNHTFDVRATDPAGNTDTSAATRSFTIDTTPPDTALTPAGTPTNDTTPTWAFSSEPGATFECRIDGASFAPCTTPFTSAVLTAGSHTFEVRAIDAAGNADPSPATQTLVIDLTAPGAPAILSPAAGARIASRTVVLSGTAEAGSAIEVREGADLRASTAASDGTWAVTLADVPDGVHTYSVRATDAAGNRSVASTRTVTIDTGAPNTSITGGPDGPTTNATPTFTFAADEQGVTFECAVDDRPFAACASPTTTSALVDGAHTFAVRATDGAGNTDATPAIRAFTVDTTPPAAPVVTGGPDGATTDASPAFTFTAGETVSCRLDGPDGATGTFAACASPRAFSALAPGAYVFMVRAVDAAGNERITQRAFTVTVPQQATPTPTVGPAATPTPTPTPTPVAGRSVAARPAGGTVLIKLPGTKAFVPLDPSVIRVGAEIDARKGRVELTRADGGRATFFDGIFKLSESGGYTALTLTEKLTGCRKPKRARNAATAAAKRKPKTRKLWGSGKGRFRTKGQYSAATVRGTRWLVQDTCTTTVTRVTEGVVAVRDNVKRKTVVLKKGKRYTARAKKR